VVAFGEDTEKQLVAYAVCSMEASIWQVQGSYRDEPGVITDSTERLEFKLKQVNIQSFKGPEITLAKPAMDEAFVQNYLSRQSYRQFAQKPIPLEALSQWLSCLMQLNLPDAPIPKYRYPSALGLYPVQTYLQIKPGRVEGMAGGFYYYHPQDHRLQRVAEHLELSDEVYGAYNQAITRQAAFSLLLVAHLEAIKPLYGQQLAEKFCIVEAGYMGQLLMTEAPNRQLGLCPLGDLAEFPKGIQVHQALGLSDDQRVVQCFLGGAIEQSQTTTWLQETSRQQTPAGLKAGLKTYLQEKLPAHMVPGQYVLCEQLPKTPNGKIDRKALPAPGLQASTGFSQPTTPTEALLAVLWANVLKREAVGRNDHFFELGGHSLLATQLVSRIRESFRVELPIRAIFEHPQLARLATAIDSANKTLVLPAIEVQAEGSAKVLSFAQQRLWFLNQLEGASTATYNLPEAFSLSGLLNIEALRQSLLWLMERHTSLRTCFPHQDGEATPAVRPMAGIEALTVVDLSALAPEEQRTEVQRLANAHAMAPFDLGQGPLFKADLLLLDDNNSVLLLNMHHIISDGWSMGVFVRDWQHAYAAFALGNEPSLPPLSIQYSDYAAWQRQWFLGEVLDAQVAYWARQLDGLPGLLELPTDKPRPPQQSYRGAHVNRRLPSALSQALSTLSRQQGVTVFMALLAAFNLLLSRYSRSQDIGVGSPIANRTHSHTEGLIGFFVNTLVLRSQLEPEQSFIELLHATRQTCLEAYAHQDIPFEMLVDTLKPTRSMSHSPLFQVMFVLQNNETAELALPGLAVGFVETEYPVAKFDLTLSIAEQGGQFHCSWEYATDLFAAETVERMAAHFEALLEALTLHPQQAIGSVPMLTEGDIQQLQAWNDTETDYPKDKTLVDLFEAQVESTPDSIAVVFEDDSLTYRQLNAQANRLARHLLGLAKPDGQTLLSGNPLIAIAVERSLDMIIGLLAILKAGGAYVPIDPSYPAARIRYMLGDSQAPLLLTQSHLTEPLALDGLEHDGIVLCLDKTDASDQPCENLPTREAWLRIWRMSSTPRVRLASQKGSWLKITGWSIWH